MAIRSRQMPASFGVQGPGDKHDRVGPARHDFVRGHLVVATHRHLRAQPTQIMDQVEGEAVVIVDQDDHGAPFSLPVRGLRRGFRGGQANCANGYCPRPRRACEAPRLLGGAEQRFRLVHAFLLLGARIAVGDNAGAGLHIHFSVFDQSRAQHDAGIHVAGGGEIADAAGIDAALFLFQLVDDFHGAHFRRAGHRAGRKACRQRIERVAIVARDRPPHWRRYA